MRTLLSDLEGRGYSRDLLFALLRSIDFDFLEGVDFTDRDSVDELGRRLEELEPVSAAYVRGDEYTSFELHVRNGDPNAAAAFDSSFVGGTLRRLYDEYATLAGVRRRRDVLGEAPRPRPWRVRTRRPPSSTWWARSSKAGCGG